MPSIDRFNITGMLGSGSQGKVYRCYDPQLEREVAIKVMHLALSQPTDTQELLQEARTMGHLMHPNVVSVFDVGSYQGKPFLVFELIQGKPLNQLLKRNPLNLGQTLDIMQGILEGMAQAHQQGILHRDLKPSNVLVTAEGQPKITDFGISRALREGVEQPAYGATRACYLAPETLEHGEISKQSDVFALGLIAYQMLAGRPAFESNNAARLANDVVQKPHTPLRKLVSGVHGRLIRLIDKALEKDPRLRFEDAQAMREAWLDFRRATQTPNEFDSSHATVQFLLRRIRLKSDFPALAQSISTLNELTSDGTPSSAKLANVILKDQGLTNKILKVVNSAYYGAFSGNIGTVSRAIVILGVNGIRSIAASLSLLDHFSDRPGIEKLRELLSESLYSGLAAREIARTVDQSLAEEALLGTMLRRLGRILVTFYLTDEEQEIERLIETERLSSHQAEMQVLGTSYQQVGRAIAVEWNFPRDMLECLRNIEQMPKPDEASRTEQLQIMANFADQAVNLMRQKRTEQTRQQLQKLIENYAAALNVDSQSLVQSLGGAKIEYLEFRSQFADAQHKQQFIESLEDDQPGPEDAGAHGTGVSVQPTPQPELAHPQVSSAERESTLRQGLQQVSELLESRYETAELIDLVLDILYHSMHFSRIIACLHHQSEQCYKAIRGKGGQEKQLRMGFQMRVNAKPDLLSLALTRQADIYIKDAVAQKIEADLPEWLKQLTQPASFLVLPIYSGKRNLGLIYAEYESTDGFDGNSEVLRLVRELRNKLAEGLAHRRAA